MSFQGDSIFWVEVEKIVPNPFQPRREFDEHKLKELSESIRMYGILQPLTVTKKEIHTEDGAFHSEYELIAGERRLRASRLAGLEQVPVIIRSGEDTEQEKLELAIIENLQREDLNAVDRALAFRQLADVFKLSHGQVAKKVGRSREYVSNTIRLLLLPEYMLASLQSADISEGHARSLLMLKDRPEEQDVVYREILLKKLSVREVERISRKIASDKVRKKNWAGTDPELIEIEREFTDTLGTRVQISKTDFGGKLTIDYFSDEDLQKLLVMMKSQGRMSQSIENDIPVVATPVMESPESSIMAKIAKATPLAFVDEGSAEQVVAESESDIDVGHSENPPEQENVIEKVEGSQIDENIVEEISYPKTMEETVAQSLAELASEDVVKPAEVSEIQELAQATEVSKQEAEDKEDDKNDDGLYSVRNFSL